MSTMGEILNDTWDSQSHVLKTANTVSKSITLSGSNTTVATPLFRVTGAVEISVIYGVITTDIGSNHTAAYLRLNDQTAQVDITLATGTTLSSVKAGSAIVKKGLAGSAIALQNNSAGRVSEPTTLETLYFSPFLALQKTGGVNTDIEYVYTTTNTPTTGAITFYAKYLPLSSSSALTAL